MKNQLFPKLLDTLPGYGLAITVNVLALLLTWLVAQIVEPGPFPLITAAVALSVWYSGWVAGLLSALFATIATDYFFMPPLYGIALGREDVSRFGMFMLVVLFIQSFAARQRDKEQTQQRLATIVESTNDAIISTAPDGNIVSWNQGAQKIFGYTTAEARDHPITILCETAGSERSQILHAIKTGQGINHLETQCRAKDDVPIDVALTLSPIRDARRNIVGAAMIARDLTEHKRRDRALHQAEEHFGKAFHASPIAIGISTLTEGRFIDVNESFLRLVGYSRDEVIGHTSSELKLWADPRDREKMVRLLREEGRMRDLESRFRCKSGEIRYSLSSTEFIQVGAETFLLNQLQDITERKRAEQALVKLSSALEQTDDNVIITDHHGSIEYVNPAFEKLTGYSREQAVGKSPRLLKSGQHAEAFYQQLWTTLLSGQVFRGQFVNRKKNGDLYYEEKTITPIKDPHGQLTHFVSTGRDVTERLQAYRTLERRVAERTRELDALYRADEHLYRHLQLDRVLQALIDVMIDILKADKASVQVWDAESNCLVVRAARGFSPQSVARISQYAPGDGIAGKVFQTGEMIAVEDAHLANPPANVIAEQEGIYSVLSVPIKIGGQTFGVFSVNYSARRTFSEDDKRVFLSLAQRAASAIENARLYEQTEQAAIMEERQRLARELHDSVTQSIYSLTLLAEAGRRLAEKGDVPAATHYLTRLGETAQHALKEMRLMVYEMRPLALQQIGLVRALQHRLDAVEKRAGVNARLVVEGTVQLPAKLEEELYRIAQEALNNALKHSASSMTTVTIRADAQQVKLQVSDNGKGFDLAVAGEQSGIGLNSMVERAERIGATLSIDSQPNAGTTVRLDVPVPIFSKRGAE